MLFLIKLLQTRTVMYGMFPCHIWVTERFNSFEFQNFSAEIYKIGTLGGLGRDQVYVANLAWPKHPINQFIIITRARQWRAAGESVAVNRETVLGLIHLQGLGSSQLANHLVNEINQGPCYVKQLQQSRQQSLRAYCPNIYIYCVSRWSEGEDRSLDNITQITRVVFWEGS